MYIYTHTCIYIHTHVYYYTLGRNVKDISYILIKTKKFENHCLGDGEQTPAKLDC